MQGRGSPTFSTLFQLGHELQESGRVEEAIDCYERAIRIDGEVPEAHNNLACAFLTLGQWEHGAAALEKALALRTEYAAALDNLGLVRAHFERHDEAVTLFARAADAEPANARIHVHLGDALLALQQYPQAQAAFEAALRLAPYDAAAHNGLGVALDELGQTKEAAGSFRAALAVNPEFASATCNLGNVLLKAGDIDGATACYERAVALDPRHGGYHWCLVNIRAGAIGRRHLAQMERLGTEMDTLPFARQIDLHFALASVYEHAGRYGDAFQHLHAGNSQKRSRIDYDERAQLNFFASLEGAFSQAFLDAMHDCGNPSARPAFVFGMPRSGTTLVEQLLAAHPAVAAAGELHVFEHAVSQELMVPGMTLPQLRNSIRALGDRYVSATDDLAGGAARVTDKLPHNFCFAPLIHLALPNARMVHVRRDRLDTCLSSYGVHFERENLPYSYDLGELGRYYSAYERLMAKWRALLPADRFVEVDYERIVHDFEAQARRLVMFCGLPWDAKTLAFHEVRRTVRTASKAQVRRPLYGSSVGRGHRFALHLGPLIEALTS